MTFTFRALHKPKIQICNRPIWVFHMLIPTLLHILLPMVNMWLNGDTKVSDGRNIPYYESSGSGGMVNFVIFWYFNTLNAINSSPKNTVCFRPLSQWSAINQMREDESQNGACWEMQPLMSVRCRGPDGKRCFSVYLLALHTTQLPLNYHLTV